MNNVELEFAHERSSKLTSLPARGWNTNKNFPVMKCNHIRRTGLV